MGTPDSLIRTVRRQLRWTLTLRQALQLITLYLFAWGVVVVALRALGLVERQWLGWGALGIAVAAIVAVVRGRLRVPSEQGIRALCDRQQRSGGLVMSEGEIDLGGWLSRRRLAPLRIQWRSGRQWGLLAAALAFVMLAFVVPDPAVVAQRDDGRVQLADNIQTLEDRLDLLDEEQAIEAEQAEDFRETLKDLDDTAREDAMRAWEMLDHLENQLSQAAEEAAEKTVTDTGDLAELGALAEALADDQMSDLPQLDANAASEALSELADRLGELDPELAEALAEAMAKSGAEGSKLDAETLGKMAEALANGEARAMDAEMLEKLSELAGECENMGQGGSGKIQRLVEGRLIDPEWAALCEEAGESDGAAMLAAMLGTGGGQGIGNASAPATLAEAPIRTDDAAFEPVALSPAAIDREGSTLIGLSSTAPEVDLPEQRSSATALDGAASGGGGAASQVILPRHRGAVQRYFDRE
ncbi:MAG: hypothetical protein WD294_14340 [Phycisphaeraceae bacterium]